MRQRFAWRQQWREFLQEICDHDWKVAQITPFPVDGCVKCGKRCVHSWQPDPDARPMHYNAFVALCQRCGKREIHKRSFPPEADAAMRRNLERLETN